MDNLEQLYKVVTDTINVPYSEISTDSEANASCMLCYSASEQRELEITNECVTPEFHYQLSLPQKSIITVSEKKNKLGETSLHIACKKKDLYEICRLVSLWSNIHAQDNSFWTPLHEAVLTGCTKIVKKLLRWGCVVNAPGFNYTTPLHFAAFKNDEEMCKLLVLYGADPLMKTYRGQSSLNIVTNELREQLLSIEQKQARPTTVMWPQPTVLYILGEHPPDFDELLQVFKTVLTFVIASNMDENVTHVISTHREKMIPASFEVLLAIVRTVPIITIEWMMACVVHGHLIDYEVYYVIGNNIINYEAVRFSQISKFQLHPKLFDGCHFYVVVDNFCKVDDLSLSKNQLKALITAGNGKILTREPTVQSVSNNDPGYPWHAPINSSVSECCNYIIYTPIPCLKLLYRMKDLKHVPYHWLIESILKYKLVPPEHMLLQVST